MAMGSRETCCHAERLKSNNGKEDRLTEEEWFLLIEESLIIGA
jgi:hypothetical protein